MDIPNTQPPGIANLTQDELETPPLTLRQLTWLRFKRHKLAVIGVIVLALLFAYSFGGSLFLSESYANYNDTTLRLNPPSAAHPFGTDSIGRDILARTMYGGQISLMIGLTAVTIETIVGVLIADLAGYYGGFIDNLLMRITEAMLNIPEIFLLIVMAKFFGGKLPTVELLGREFSGSVIVIVMIIGMTSWMYLARIVRAEFLSIKENEFILAARATGTRSAPASSAGVAGRSPAPRRAARSCWRSRGCPAPAGWPRARSRRRS